MSLRAATVAAGRSLLATPYHSHGRKIGIGVDCIGVPIVASWISGLRPRSFDIRGYNMTPDGSMLRVCDELLEKVARVDMQPGDVVVVRFGVDPHHVGLVADARHGGLTMIHAENYRHNKVIEHRLWLDGAMKFVAAYRIPGIES